MEEENESEISENKTIDNKSILSLNFIYKKITIKKDVKNIKDNLRTLNYEKIAKYKMKNMSINFLINSIFKLKKTLQKTNPIMKYIKNVKPYDYTNILNTVSNKEQIIKEYLKNNNKKIPFNINNKKEKHLDLTHKEKHYKNYYYSRMANIDKEKVIKSRKEKVIFIQKYIRGFLCKKILNEEVSKIIIKKFIEKILLIQKHIKEFLHKKKSLNNIIINIINTERKIKSNKITDLFSLFHFRNYYKKKLLIEKIIEQRKQSILLIQNKYRSFIYKKKVKEIILKEKDVYVLNYPFKASSVKINIYYNMNKAFKVFEFFKCPIRKYFITYIDKDIFTPGEYLCRLYVNGNFTLDQRYKYFPNTDNNLYNLIYIGDTKPQIEIDINNKKSKKKKKRKKKIKIEEEEETSDDFYYYCYNDNTNSTNSLSTKSYNENNLNNKNKRNKYSIDSQSIKKEKSIQSQKIKYNNILNELNQSISSSKSHFSLNKINSYSKNTHKTKFGNNKKK